MNIIEVRDIVSKSYCMEISFIEKIKNVYRIISNEKQYCLKIIKYNFSHFFFILSAIKHLQSRGFESIPEIIKTEANNDYICLHEYFGYLTEWVPGRQCSYDNPVDVSIAAQKLAELHNKSEEFIITEDMQPRIGWFKWADIFNTRKNEILDFSRLIEEKQEKSQFDIMYLNMMKEEVLRAENSTNNLLKSQYIQEMLEEIEYKGFCHHDYAHHNILINDTGQVNVIDFDYCMLDTHLHDVASLMLRRMKNGKWGIKNAICILDAYSKNKQIKKHHIPVMAAFMEFPQDYWQIGIQYYLEKQPWGEEFFISKLKKNLEDRNDKQDFIDEFRLIKGF